MRRAAGKLGPGERRVDRHAATRSSTGASSRARPELQTLVSEVAELDVAVPFAPRYRGPGARRRRRRAWCAPTARIELEIRSTLTGEGFTLPEGRKTIVVAKRVARSPTELKKK